MKRIVVVLGFMCMLRVGVAQSFEMEGGALSPFTHTPEASTGLQQIYVVDGFEGVRLTFRSKTQNTFRWYAYKERLTELTPLEGEQNGEISVLRSPLQTNTGYVVQDGAGSYCVWVVDYSVVPSVLNALLVSNRSESPCRQLQLEADHTAPPIYYYTINGVRKKLERQYRLAYTTLAFNPKSKQFDYLPVEQLYTGDFTTLAIDPPYCDTEFELTGDQFAIHFHRPSKVKSKPYNAVAVALHTEAYQGNTDSVSNLLGGSAPVTIHFEAYANTPTTRFYLWEYGQDPTFNSLIASYPEARVQLNFEQSGSYYVRCSASNEESSCVKMSEVYRVEVSDSYLRVPNAFSPQGSPGINDLFKPRSKSLVKFEAYIFDKWGVELFRWSDPNGGWDGKHNGKYVMPGPYYYVIRATGADGKQYHLKGDINVVGGE